MGILDLFRPRWKNSDPAVRADAVRGLYDEDVAILKKVAIGDSDSAVQRLAVKRLADPFALKAVADAVDGAVGGVARRKAEELFGSDAMADIPPPEAKAALEQLSGRAALIQVACKATLASVRAGAVAKLKDDPAKAEVVKKAEILETRLGALDKIKDRKVLTELAITLTEKRVAMTALDAAGRFAPLDEIAKRAKNKQVAKEAARRHAQKAAESGDAPEVTAPATVTDAQRRYARRSQICRLADALLDRAGEGHAEDKQKVMAIESEWQELGDELGDPLSVRFHKTVDRFYRTFQDAVERERAKAEALAEAEAMAALKAAGRSSVDGGQDDDKDAPPQASRADGDNKPDAAQDGARKAQAKAEAKPEKPVVTDAQKRAWTEEAEALVAGFEVEVADVLSDKDAQDAKDVSKVERVARRGEAGSSRGFSDQTVRPGKRCRTFRPCARGAGQSGQAGGRTA